MYDENLMSLGSKNKRGEISLNHLINFSFPVRQPLNAPISRVKKKSNFAPFNKEKFVNANFRFVLEAEKDYSVYLGDADVSIQWEDIEQVLEVSAKPQNCPICLSPPVAAKITKCGHVYCFPCILQYLHLSESNTAMKWRECPICQELICARDLKSTVALTTSQNVDGVVYGKGIPRVLELRLMKRDMSSTVVLPRSEYDRWANTSNIGSGKVIPPSSENLEAYVFSKLIISSPSYIISEILKPELSELKKLEAEKVQDEEDIFSMTGMKADCGVCFAQLALEDVLSSDGQQIYLHPLDIKILKLQFGTYSSFPDTITVELISVQESTVTEDLRKRCKYLSHLPISCDITFCEVDLTGVVEEKTLDYFDRELSERINRIRSKNFNESGKQKTLVTSYPDLKSNSYQDESYSNTPYLYSVPPSTIDVNDEFEFPVFPSKSSVPSDSHHYHQFIDAEDQNYSSEDDIPRNDIPLSKSCAPISFAKIASTESSKKSNSPGNRNYSRDYDDHVDEYVGWTLDLEDSLDSIAGGGAGSQAKIKGKKKKNKNMVVVSNGGARGRT
ncbi:hypothetical protein HK096_007448 [Nowakowskiella sp. JEL0078]|nr:hypothetical protein HK096_007448 [Nowakowskiella sp. JEL0078]